MKLPKELLEKNKRKRITNKINRKNPIPRDQMISSKKHPHESLINETIKWMEKYNAKEILTWIEVISIHPSNQIYQVRFEFLIAVLLSIKPSQFKNNNLRYNELKRFIQNFEKNSAGLFIEDYEPYPQLNLIPYFFQGKKYYFFYGLTGRIYEILKKLECIYIFQEIPESPEFKVFKSFFINILDFQTKILNVLKKIKESEKQIDKIYVPTSNYYRKLEPLLKIKPESIVDKKYIIKFGNQIKNFSEFHQNLFNGTFYKSIHIQISKNLYYMILPQTQIETLFFIFKKIVLNSPNKTEVVRYIDANLLRNLTLVCGEFFTRKALILNIFNSKKELLSQNIDTVTIYDNYLFLFKLVNTFDENRLSEEVNSAYDILNDKAKKLANEEELMFDNGSRYLLKMPTNELFIFKFIIYESIDLNVSMAGLKLEKSLENQLFSMMDITIMFEMLSSELKFIKYIKERETYLKSISTIDGINLLAVFLRNNESLPDYGEVRIMLDPHFWTDYYNKFLYEKFQDNIYELIELEATRRYNKVIKWENSQDLYECFNTFSLYGACLIKLDNKLIWIYYPAPDPKLNMKDLRYIMRLFGPLYADYIQRTLPIFQKIFRNYHFYGDFRLFLYPIKICANNPKYEKFQEDYNKVSEIYPLVVVSLINPKNNLNSLIIYNAEYWVNKYNKSTMNEGPKFAIEQLLHSILKTFEQDLPDNEVREKINEMVINDFPEGPNDYCVTPVIIKNLKIKNYRPYISLNQTDQESIIKKIESFLRSREIKQGSLSPSESKGFYNDMYLEFYKKLEEAIMNYDKSLLCFSYQQLEFIEGARYKLLIDAGLRSRNVLEEKFLEYFREKQLEISNLSSSVRFIIESTLKTGIKGEKQINIEEWGYFLSLSLYLLMISQRSEFTHTEIMPFTIEIKEYQKFDEIQNPAVFNYDDFVEAEFKRKLETAEVIYDSVKEESEKLPITDEESTTFISLIEMLDNSFMNEFSFTYTKMMRVLYLLSITELFNPEYYPICIISEGDLIKELKTMYQKLYIDQDDKNYSKIIPKDEEIHHILNYISLNFISYGDEILLPIKLLKQKERVTLCPLIQLEDDTYLFGNECCSLAFNLWKTYILSGVFPYKLTQENEIENVLQQIHSFRDTLFEEECGDVASEVLGKDYVEIKILNFKRISDSFPKRPDCGEIDFLAINPENKTIFIFDAKNYFLRLIPYDIKNEFNRFIESKKSDLKKLTKKVKFVNDNLNLFLDFFKITDLSDWNIKKGFIIKKNFPTKHIPDVNADFVFINELGAYLKGE